MPPSKPISDVPTSTGSGAGQEPEMQSLAEAQRRKEIAIAKSRELDLAEREGKLMDTEDARRAWSSHISSAASRFLLLPAKIAPRVATMTDPVAIQMFIDREIRLIMSELAEYVPNAA